MIDGHNRFDICSRHEIPFEVVVKHFPDISNAREWIIRNQFGRRNLLPYIRTKLSLELEETISARNKLNQIRKPADSVVPISAQQNPIKTRDEVAKIAGVGHDTVAKVKKIEAKATPEVKAKLASGELSINQAHQQITRGRRKAPK